MSFGEQFILFWMTFILVLAFLSYADGLRRKRKQRRLEHVRQMTVRAQFREQARQDIANTKNFHRANRYYHEFE